VVDAQEDLGLAVFVGDAAGLVTGRVALEDVYLTDIHTTTSLR
jgi:hypothetical protein